MRLLAVSAAAALFVALAAPAARADDDTDALAKSAAAALAASRPADAIASYEALADRGVVDPNMSLDRGLAYAQRVRLAADLPGDLGRAAQGFEEARELTADPKLAADATSALTTIRAEVARRRARAGESPSLEPGMPLGRSIAHVAPENAWAVLAAVASALLGLGLFVRGLSTARRGRVGGAVVASVAAPLLVLSAIFALMLRDERLHLREGVVVVPTARLTDEGHRPLPQSPFVPEAAKVEILDTRAGWARVRWAALDGWVSSSAVRPIARAE